MQCPHCQSQKVVKNGNYQLQDGSSIQHYLCKTCHKRFSDKTGTPMARLRTPSSIVSIALKMRSEGMGVRASSRVLDKSHSTILRWETRMAAQVKFWSPPAPVGSDITLEHDELYTRVGENLPPQ
jgi:transposase-like protein